LNVLNMLNTKYFILNPSNRPLVNDFALGNAWFVDEVQMVKSADEEINALSAFDPSKTAIVDEEFSAVLNVNLEKDSLSQIELISYEPNYLIYKTSSSKSQLAIFSEIFYAKGWNAYIDGELHPHLRANYVLRALPVPAGNHQIEFKFEPKSYAIGRTISFISSLLVLLMFAGGLGFEIKKLLQAK